MNYDVPHVTNFCGGNFQDWLEVMLTPRCNGKCSWCVEKKGWHPKEKANWWFVYRAIRALKRKNVILLGGEPTLYPDIDNLIYYLAVDDYNVYITTNGSKINDDFIWENKYLKGINISIHSDSLEKNKEITGIDLNYDTLMKAIDTCQTYDIHVRFNCNLIKAHIDSEEKINDYIKFAKGMGAKSVRFAELKDDLGNFVDLYKIYGSRFDLNNDPFIMGCHKSATINGMPVNFRQMCGLQTSARCAPKNPQQFAKQVVYYDGNVYNGWQQKEDKEMQYKKLIEVLELYKSGDLNIDEVVEKIREYTECSTCKARKAVVSTGAGCQY